MGQLKVFLCIAIFVLVPKAYALKNSHPAIEKSSTFNVLFQVDGVHKGETYTGYCNGSLIADDLIVTAAHCLAGSTNMLEKAKVYIGNYISKSYPNGNTSTFYYYDLDVVGIKSVYFLNHLNKKIHSGKLTNVAAISAYDDIALIQLTRPVDRSKVPVQVISVATPNDYKLVATNPNKYQFIAVSTNPLAESSLQTKRYAPIAKMSINKLFNKAYRVPMWSTDMYHQVEEGDSGAPLLVNVSGKWKLFAVTKGTKRDSLSAGLERLTGKSIRVTPELNMFTPVANKICDLLTQAKRTCP